MHPKKNYTTMEHINFNSIAEHNPDYILVNKIALCGKASELYGIWHSDLVLDGILFVVVIRGTIDIYIDGETVSLKANDLIVCNKNRVIQNVEPSSDLEIRAFYLSCDYADSLTKLVKYDWTVHLLESKHKIIPLTQDETRRFMLYYDLILCKLLTDNSKCKDDCIESLLSSLAYELFDISEKIKEKIDRQTYSPSENIFQRFIYILRNENTPYLTVNEYAARLNITPKYFSGICKKLTGKTAGQIITEEVIYVAKQLLCDNSISIKQIANRLNFATQSHFGAFFHRNTGMSPQQYRQQKD